MFGLQPLHIFIIIVVGLVIFGPFALPRLGRGLGKSIADLGHAVRTTPDEIRRGLDESADRQPDGPAAPPSNHQRP